MGRRIESETARATIGLTRGIHVLQKLAFVLDHSSILETGAVFHTRNVAAENADSAAVQTTINPPSSVVVSLLNVHFGCRAFTELRISTIIRGFLTNPVFSMPEPRLAGA